MPQTTRKMSKVQYPASPVKRFLTMGTGKYYFCPLSLTAGSSRMVQHLNSVENILYEQHACNYDYILATSNM